MEGRFRYTYLPDAKESVMSSTELINICQKKLLKKKDELLNRLTECCGEFSEYDFKGGDEGDQAIRSLKEGEFLYMNERFQRQLTEVERALARIEEGSYGVCEVTGDRIEPERLKTIPWTSCSIEGAEIRESMGKKYAR